MAKARIFRVYETSKPPYTTLKKVWEGYFGPDRTGSVRREITKKIGGRGISTGTFYVVVDEGCGYVDRLSGGFPVDFNDYIRKVRFSISKDELTLLVKAISEEGS